MEDTTIRVLALDLDGTLTNDEKKNAPEPGLAAAAPGRSFYGVWIGS